MMRAVAVVLLSLAAPALAAPKKNPPKQDAASPEQKEADKHFKAGVALFNEAKFAEALAEFERAYEVAPHPLVLNNIAACHRELSHYGEAVKYYTRFLDEGKGKVPAARLAEAQKDLDGVLARIARITVTVTPGDGAKVSLDGSELGTMPLDMPLMVPPGEHKLVARATGRRDAERTVRVASGDAIEVKLELAEAPAEVKPDDNRMHVDEHARAVEAPPKVRRFVIGAGFGTNLLLVPEAGAPTLNFGVVVHPRIQLGIDGILLAYAVMPNVRIRLLGDAFALHVALAMPISFTDGAMSETFVAGAVGLGVRYRPLPAFALRVESFAAFAGKAHGTTLPTFVGGEVWF